VCATCHVGYGFISPPFDTNDPGKIDCLACHDGTKSYKKDVASGGMPEANVNLAAVARGVTRPTRDTCGSCHFYSDGGANVKHGDLEPILSNPPAEFDVHMGRLDMRCQECHTTDSHRIAGRSLSSPATEGSVSCERCHGKQPHGIAGMTSRHLDAHVSAIACETCHIPLVARYTPTQTFIDYSQAGLDAPSDGSTISTKPIRFGVLESDDSADLAPARGETAALGSN